MVNHSKLGMIHIYNGTGKGKTTAAMGLAMRALGAGLKVAIVYFDKGGKRYSERKILKKLAPAVRFWATGTVRTDFRRGGRFRFENRQADFEEAQRGLKLAREAIVCGDFDLVILDEILSAIKTNLLTKPEILGLIGDKPDRLELVLTGRVCPAEIAAKADLISHVKEVKHYFQRGIPAREGIDF